MSLDPTISCPCRSAHTVPTFVYDAVPEGETSFDLRGQLYNRAYRRCVICDHWFGEHEIDLSTLYSDEYAEATYGGAEGMARRYEKIMALPADRSDNRCRVAAVVSFMDEAGAPTQGRRVLDVGAGIGVFPAAMREEGWIVTAIEPDPNTVQHLDRVARVEAHAIDLFDMKSAEWGPYDLIAFNKVLEHVENPKLMLEHALTLLAPEGVIYVEVPDVAAAVDGPGREEFFVEHHHVFSPASLAILARESGLSPRRLDRLREPSGKYTLRAFLQIKGVSQ